MDTSEPTTESDSDHRSNTIDELPLDLQLDILKRLEPKTAAGAAAGVSKWWHRLITSHCIPKTSPSGLPFASALFFHDDGGPQSPRAALFRRKAGPTAGDVDLCTNIRPFPPWLATPEYSLLGCSNGLLLYRHVRGGAETCCYFVFNYATGQSVSVNVNVKAESRSCHAVLAYAPARSSFFRIVQFDGMGTGFVGSMRVYWSETRRWKRVAYMLNEHVVEAEWSEQCFFLGGAVYRLSGSGHLLRFEVEEMEDLCDQAVAIELPKEASKEFSKMCFGVSENRIHFMSFDADYRLRIWSLADGEQRGWVARGLLTNLHRKREFEGSFMKPLGFHPNSNVAFIGANSKTLGSAIMWIRIDGDDDDNDGDREVEYVHRDHKTFVEDWRGVVAFPFLYCDVPFASGFEYKPS